MRPSLEEKETSPEKKRKYTKKRPNTMTVAVLESAVDEYLNRCTLCSRCLDVCPVYDADRLSVDELNQVTSGKSKAGKNTHEFIFACSMCGECTTACPEGNDREMMMLLARRRLFDKRPFAYRRYLIGRGPREVSSWWAHIAQQLFIAKESIIHNDLKDFMHGDIVGDCNEGILWYPGCYVHSPETMRTTYALLDWMGMGFGVLGGIEVCCGLPHLLQGDLESSEACLDALEQQLSGHHPSVILSGCRECVEGMHQVKIRSDAEYDVMGIVEFLARFKDRFPIGRRVFNRVLVIPSCRTREDDVLDTVSDVIMCFVDEVVEAEGFWCCGHWNLGCDKGIMKQRMQDVLKQAQMADCDAVVCDCLTCVEEARKFRNPNDIPVVDVLDVVVAGLELGER